MKKLYCLVIGFYYYGVQQVFAGPPPVGGGKVLPGPANTDTTAGTTQGSQYVTESLIPGITNTIILFILSVSVLMVVIGGILYIASGGDTEKTKKAKDTIVWSIVGVALSLLAYGIVKLIIGINFSG